MTPLGNVLSQFEKAYRIIENAVHISPMALSGKVPAVRGPLVILVRGLHETHEC